MASIFSIDYHKQCLKNLCCICGNRAQTHASFKGNENPHLCKNSVDKIQQFYSIGISRHQPETHPETLCNSCFKKMRNGLKKSNSDISSAYAEEKEKAVEISKLWTVHKAQNCQVCILYTYQKTGGRPKKVRRGNPFLGKKIKLKCSEESMAGPSECDNIASDCCSNIEISELQSISAIHTLDTSTEATANTSLLLQKQVQFNSDSSIVDYSNEISCSTPLQLTSTPNKHAGKTRNIQLVDVQTSPTTLLHCSPAQEANNSNKTVEIQTSPIGTTLEHSLSRSINSPLTQ